MRRGGRILIILGLFLGIAAAVVAFMVLGSQTQQAQTIATRSVVISLQPIPARTEIKAEAVGKIDWPEPVPAGAFEKIDDVVGKMAIQPLFPGQLVLPQSIIDKGKGISSSAALIVPEGKIAVSFSFDNVAGAAQAGDYVDMMMTLSASPPPTQTTTTTTRTTLTGNEGLAVTQMFLQNVLILQVGPWPAPGAAPANAGAGSGVLTFALDRQDALAVKSASEQGTIQLILRRAGDNKIATTEPVTLQYLNKRFNFNLVPASTAK